MGILDNVPDLIREAALKNGMRNEGASSNTVGSFGAVPAPLKTAYQQGDYKTIQHYTDITANDLNPIYGNIQNNQEKSFFQITNPSNNTPYWLSIAGPAKKPYGYMWSYVPPVPSVTSSQENGDDDAPISQPVAQFGTYSANSNTLGISNQIWDNTIAQLGAGAIATIVMTTVTKYISKRISGALVPDAVSEAVAEGGTELVAEGVVEAGAWVGITAFVGGLVVGAVVGAIVFFLIMFIVNTVYKDYKVGINIYNWDLANNYTINGTFGSNETLDGKQPFVTTALPSPSNTITMPDGTVIPTGSTVYQYAAFIYDNVSKFMQGLGVAMQVQSEDLSTGFQLKYLCSYYNDNTLGLTGGLESSLSTYYNDASTWAPVESYSASSTIPNLNVPISCTTTSLSGRSDQFYQFDVHIGLKPDTQFGEPRDPPPAKKPLLPRPEKAIVPHVGDKVTLPDGSHVKVVGNLLRP